jgi:hypothetical protein
VPEYDEFDDTQPEAVAIDERVMLMQKISDMEQAHANLQREGEKIAKKAAELGSLINEARNDLAARMGWDHGNKRVRAMASEEAARATADSLQAFYGGSR